MSAAELGYVVAAGCVVLLCVDVLDEARRAAEAERDALCRMFNQDRSERRLPWERDDG